MRSFLDLGWTPLSMAAVIATLDVMEKGTVRRVCSGRRERCTSAKRWRATAASAIRRSIA
jgi:hypothetical protein